MGYLSIHMTQNHFNSLVPRPQPQGEGMSKKEGKIKILDDMITLSWLRLASCDVEIKNKALALE